MKHIKQLQWPMLILLTAFIAVLIYREELLRLVGTPTVLSTYLDHINDRAQKIQQDAQVLGDWEVEVDGLYLRSGQRGEVIYKITKEPDEDLNLNLGVHWTGLEEIRLEISTDGVHYQTVGSNLQVANRYVLLTPYALGSSEIFLRIIASAAETGSAETYVALDWIQIVKIKNPIALPYLPGLFLFIAIPLSLYAWARAVQLKFALAIFAAALGAEALASALWPNWIFTGLPLANLPSLARFVTPQLGPYVEDLAIPWIWFLYAAGTVIALSMAPLIKPGEGVQKFVVSSLLVAIIALGFVLRWEALTEFQYRPLDPDAVGYRQIADNMRHLYDTSFREPLWIWATKLWFLVVGSSDLNLRMLTLVLSLLTLVAAYKFFKDYTKQPVLALLVVALLAINPYLIFMSVRGLRLELYTIAILMLAYHVLIRQERLGEKQRLAGLSGWGAAAVLQQINSLVFVLPLWGYAFWRQKIVWKKLFIPIAVLMLLLAPYLAYSYQKFGDPFWSANVHAKWYRNYEFVVLKGISCEGCPTLEQFRAKGHSGAPVTTFQYIFGMHSLGEIISRTISGYLDLFLRPTHLFWKQAGLEITPLYYLYLMGLLLVIFSRFREILIFPILTINLIAFLVPLGIDPRLVVHTAPFLVFIYVYAAWFVLVQGVTIFYTVRRRLEA